MCEIASFIYCATQAEKRLKIYML